MLFFHFSLYNRRLTIDSLSNINNRPSLLSSSSSPSTSTIAPQATALRQQPSQPLIQAINTTGINDTVGQNYTFATISPTLASGKLMYLGYHDDSGGSSRSSGQSTTHSSSSNDKSSGSSDSKPSNHHSNTGSTSDSGLIEKKTDSGSTKLIRTDNTNTDSGSKDKSSHNTKSSTSDTKSSSTANKDSTAKKTGDSGTKLDSHPTTTTNADSSSDAKSSNSDSKPSSPANHNSGSSSDLATAIRNKVDSIIKNRLRGISDNMPFVLPFH